MPGRGAEPADRSARRESRLAAVVDGARYTALVHPALAPYVETLWASPAGAPAGLEHVLPTGAMHVVIRLDAPLTLLDTTGARATLGPAMVGGARAAYYVRSLDRPSRSVGAILRPGGALALLGVPAGALAHRHTHLEDLRPVGALRDELAAAVDPVAAFEQTLLRWLRPQALDPAVATLLAALGAGASVAAAVRSTGLSDRTCLARFETAVGLGPKAWARVRRFQRALRARGPLATVAAELGYADQAHLCRDFAALAGITPGAHRRLGLVTPNHVPASDFSKTEGPRAGTIAACTSTRRSRISA